MTDGWLQAVLDTGARPPERHYLVRSLELFPHAARGFSNLLKRHLLEQQPEAAAAAAPVAGPPGGPAEGPGPATPRSAPREPGPAAAAAAPPGPPAAQPGPLQSLLAPGPSPSGPLAQYAPWLGRWEPRFDHVRNLNELVMHARWGGTGAVVGAARRQGAVACRPADCLPARVWDRHRELRARTVSR